MSQFRIINLLIMVNENFTFKIRTLLLLQAEIPEPIHHLRTKWSIRLYSTATIDLY